MVTFNEKIKEGLQIKKHRGRQFLTALKRGRCDFIRKLRACNFSLDSIQVVVSLHVGGTYLISYHCFFVLVCD